MEINLDIMQKRHFSVTQLSYIQVRWLSGFFPCEINTAKLFYFLCLLADKNLENDDMPSIGSTFRLTDPMWRIIVTSHEHCDVSNHRQLHCLCNRLSRKNQWNFQRSAVLVHCEQNPPVTCAFLITGHKKGKNLHVMTSSCTIHLMQGHAWSISG